ncbi:hypothetical protein Salfasec13b_017 [Salmonella phage Salfasec13b]|nr:hypothetical protein Salfasec13b_017 [Salmonella phage Salfasec13b]
MKVIVAAWLRQCVIKTTVVLLWIQPVDHMMLIHLQK